NECGSLVLVSRCLELPAVVSNRGELVRPASKLVADLGEGRWIKVFLCLLQQFTDPNDHFAGRQDSRWGWWVRDRERRGDGRPGNHFRGDRRMVRILSPGRPFLAQVGNGGGPRVISRACRD